MRVALLETTLNGLPSAPGQGARRLRPGRRPPPDRRHRPDQRVRLGPAQRHPRQGAGADRPQRLLVRPAAASRNHLISTDIDDAGLDLDRRDPRGAATAGRWSSGRPRSSRSSASSAATSRAAAGRSTGRRDRSAASALPAGPRRERPARPADLHPGHQGRDRPRRERPVRRGWPRRSASGLAERLAGREPRRLPQAPRRYAELAGLILADTKFEWGCDPRDRRAAARRRGADPRQLPLLARRPLQAGRPAAVVRQAVRPRLARNDRLGQGEPAPAAARRRGGAGPARNTSKPTRS